MRFSFLSQFIKMFFFLFCGSNDLFKLTLLGSQNSFLGAKCFFSLIQSLGFFSYFFIGILNMFFTQLYFQLLHLHFFIDSLKLPVILYVFALLFIFFDQRFGFLDCFFLLSNKLCNTVDLFFDTKLTSMQTVNFIFQVSHP